MKPNLATLRDGKKFIWDGRCYETSEEASRVKEAYQYDGFEVRMVEEAGKFLIYTRRLANRGASTVQ